MKPERLETTWLDRVISRVAPGWGLRRLQSRATAAILARHYEAASTGRRTQGWRSSTGDANAVVGGVLGALRAAARDLVRNNGYAESALSTIADHVVGWGIVAKPQPDNARAAAAWKAWAESTDCDADGRNDFYGLQKLVERTVVESGECLVRRRTRRPEDGYSLPLQLQVLEPDFIDTLKTGITTRGGGRIVHGVEFDVLGKRVAYWLFPEHPGSQQLFGLGLESRRIPAEGILHVYEQKRAGQVRGATWFAPVLLKFKDFDEFDDATLLKQKIAACLAIITTDQDGSNQPLGSVAAGTDIDSLEPGAIINAPPGRQITVVDPPQVGDYSGYTAVTLRAIATGLGVAYEDLTGDYTDLPFSAARMSRLRHWARVYDWRWRTLIPQFCAPAWAWAMQAAQIMGKVGGTTVPAAVWTAPPPPMIEPDKEGLAYQRLVRSGLMSLSEALRERGYDPRVVLEELASDFEKLDELGLVLDTDPRKTTQQGGPRETAQAAPKPDDDGGQGGGGKAGEGADDDDDDQEDEAAAANAADSGRAVAALARAVTALAERPPAPPAPVNVDARTMPGAIQVDARTSIAEGAVKVEAPTNIHEGAVRTDVSAPTTIAPGAVQVDARIAEGAVHVEAPTNIHEGAVRTEVGAPNVTIAPGAVQVDAPTNIHEGAIRTEIPLTVAEKVEAPAARTVFERDKRGRLTGFRTEGAGEVKLTGPPAATKPERAADERDPEKDK